MTNERERVSDFGFESPRSYRGEYYKSKFGEVPWIFD